jgi:5-methylcytosine-specific restriction protein A
MPDKALIACNIPGCPARTERLRCPAHSSKRKQQYDLDNPNRQAYYKSLEWRAKRKRILKRDPFCVTGCGKLSRIVDHRIARENGGTDDDDNLQGLCTTCHNRKTAKYDGGFGNQRKSYGT